MLGEGVAEENDEIVLEMLEEDEIVLEEVISADEV